GLVFNIGNIAGCGLGLKALFGIPEVFGAAISAAAAIMIFCVKEAGKAMDFVVKILGVVMLGLICYVVFASKPPIGEAAYRTMLPIVDSSDSLAALSHAIVTLVGGTVGGYITFAGAHRLIDAGVTGPERLREVNRGATTGIAVTAIIRFALFLAAFGVVALGMKIDPSNPPASVFQNAAGEFGFRVFGIVMWAAALTSVIGAAFTSSSFLRSFHPLIAAKSNIVIIAFILVSTAIFLIDPKPVQLLVWAGTVNGFILPIGLTLVLLASRKRTVVGDYVHPKWLQMAGWTVVAVMLGFMAITVYNSFRQN
ncbi:MAG TPA: divalent metal cation transporter, partial [Pyrinomonadaceae bacterium]|nr:divalent metal cation transporter [Pyrinomonadaceae bacterium]